MNLILNLPPELEAVIKKRAKEAGLELSEFVVRTLLTSETEREDVNQRIPDEQFQASLNRLIELHKDANPSFDDSRESIYEGRDE